MIGKLTEDMTEVGYYEQAQKVVRAALTVLSALQIVMNSRIANAYATKDEKEVKSCLEKSFNFTWLLSVPMIFGLIAVAPKFVPWYYGEGFEGVTSILIATAPILIAIGLNGITGTQYLVQTGKQKVYTISVVVGAITNVIFNIILIHYLNGVGAAISSLIAELVIFSIQLKYFKEQFSLLEILKMGTKCLISGVIMFIVVKLLTDALPISIMNTAIEIVIGAITYTIMLVILKYKFLKDIYLQVSGGIKNKLRRT